MLKIALFDLNHITRGVHTNTVPLGLGLISTYLQKNIDQTLDIKLFKETDKVLNTLKSWIPDIIGIAQYSWNSELNLCVAKIVTKINPNCVIIAGGPNLDLSNKGKYNFLKNNSHVDIGVMYDGEIPFANIVKRILLGEPINEIKKNLSAGVYAIDPETKRLNEPSENPPRLDSLDVFGSVYVDGIFDEFLKEGYRPFVQTHRGCPFTCAFCHTSDSYYSRMLFLSPEIFRKDMEYLGKFFTKRHDVALEMANTNMGLFKEDFLIAKIIREIQKKYSWPKIIRTNSGKDPKKLLDMLSIIEFLPSIAFQTLTPHVLKNIRRKNISLSTYSTFQNEVLQKIGKTSTTELILSLPGETKKTFLKTLRTVMNSGVQNIVIYTLMNLKGTPLASEKFANNYNFMICHRIVPRQFSLVNEQKIFDTEEVVVGTKDMPFEDYLELRGLSFTVATFFGSTELIPLKRFLLEYKINIAKWIFNVHAKLSEYSNVYANYNAFLKETKEELFDTRKELVEFYSKPENYEDLISGMKGDNLLRKYKCLVLSENYESYLKLAISEARKLLCKKNGNELIDDIALYLSSRNMKNVLSRGKLSAQNVILNYDIPKWLMCTDGRLLEEFKGKNSYIVKFTPDIKRELDDFMKMNKEESLSLQILYRDGSIKDLWPIWTKNK